MKPYEEYSSFNNCSAPKCPLDPDIDLRERRHPGEEKCRGEKPTRVRIASKYPELLPFKGLTKREYNGMKQQGTLERYLDRVRRDLILHKGAKLKKSRKKGIPVPVCEGF